MILNDYFVEGVFDTATGTEQKKFSGTASIWFWQNACEVKRLAEKSVKETNPGCGYIHFNQIKRL